MRKLRIVSALVASATFVCGTAFAADLILPSAPTVPYSAPIYDAGFQWDGFYAGVLGGAQFAGTTNGVVGGFIGTNFDVGNGFVAGLELSGDYIFRDTFRAGEFFASGRAGALVTDNVLAYAKAGVGYRTTNNGGPAQGAMYSFGGGLELAVTDAVTVRGEVLGQGFMGSGALNGGAPVAAKTTLGVAYHF